MRQHHPALARRPLEDAVVVSAGQPCILHADDIELWEPTNEAANDVRVEVLVHARRSIRRTVATHQPTTRAMNMYLNPYCSESIISRGWGRRFP